MDSRSNRFDAEEKLYHDEQDDLDIDYTVPMFEEGMEFNLPHLVNGEEDPEMFANNQERIEWQGMLASVLTGDVIEMETIRIAKTMKDHLNNTEKYQLWLALNAHLHSRSIPEYQIILDQARLEADAVIDTVINFQIEDNDISPLEQVNAILQKVDFIEGLYPSTKYITHEKPQYGSEPFQRNLNALTSWSTISKSLKTQYKILTKWTGNEELKVSNTQLDETSMEQATFVDRILKENSLQNTFEKQTLYTLNTLLYKTRENTIENCEAFDEMKLPSYVAELERMVGFPTSLMQECLRLRLDYAQRLSKPTIIIVDQMLDDFRVILSLAFKIKQTYQTLVQPGPGWYINSCISSNYDIALFGCLKFYFKLLHWKLKGGNKTINIKEAEIMKSEWEFLKTFSTCTETSSFEIAEQFCSLIHRLLCRLLLYFESQLVIDSEASTQHKIKWQERILQISRLRVSKMMLFSNELSTQFENSTEYSYDQCEDVGNLTRILAATHILVDFGAVNNPDNVYVLINEAVLEYPDMIKSALTNCIAQDDIDPCTNPSYILLVSNHEDLIWEGRVLDYFLDIPKIELKPGRIRLVSTPNSLLQVNKQHFQMLVQGTALAVTHPSRPHSTPVHRELLKIKQSFFKLTVAIIDSVSVVRGALPGQTSVDPIQNYYLFASSLGQRAMKTLDIRTRARLTMKLMQLSIDWVHFIRSDCIPTDRKTFRWAVVALKFAMLMTSGYNILLLGEEEFDQLRTNVAGCMTLLISHFDIQGARAINQLNDQAAMEKTFISASNEQLEKVIGTDPSTICNTLSYKSEIFNYRDNIIKALSELESSRFNNLSDLGLAGKVLDDQRPEDKSLLFLASSSTNISIRWQQRKFLGAGTFGSVYLAVNLDSGDIMAVKEIRFPDPSQLMSLYKSIKEEMSVMEMLNHPNIVSYYGIEVHRDRVFIFMEYCQGGSLGSLLSHGRIEDENVVKVYTFQMLQGLEYLHDQGVLHRDVKPDNILLDHMGIIKFVDFGAAKVIAKNQRTVGKNGTMNGPVNKTLTGTPMYMAPEVIKGADKGNKGAQDIWSLGCCVLQMVTGKQPWSNLDNEWAIMYHVAMGHPPLPDPSQISELGMDFLSLCFTRQPHKRPTAKALLMHEWFRDIAELNCDQRQAYTTAVLTGSLHSNSTKMGLITPTGSPSTASANMSGFNWSNSATAASISASNSLNQDAEQTNSNVPVFKLVNEEGTSVDIQNGHSDSQN